MNLERSTRYSHYNLNYHIVIATKYRKKLLRGTAEDDFKLLVKDICAQRDWIIHSQEVMPDHAHLFLSCPPKWSPADVVKIIKGVTARALLQKYPHLRQRGHLWTNSYYVGSAGFISSETIIKYIENQKNAEDV